MDAAFAPAKARYGKVIAWHFGLHQPACPVAATMRVYLLMI
jgi:hypothetical protein